MSSSLIFFFPSKNSKFGCLLFVEIIPSLVVVAALLFCSWRGRKRLAPLPQLIKCLDPSGLQKMHLFFYVMKLEFSFLNFKFPNFWIEFFLSKKKRLILFFKIVTAIGGEIFRNEIGQFPPDWDTNQSNFGPELTTFTQEQTHFQSFVTRSLEKPFKCGAIATNFKQFVCETWQFTTKKVPFSIIKSGDKFNSTH